MKYSCLFTILLLVQFNSSAQTQTSSAYHNCILNDTVYKKGIYRTFEEYKYNKPSIVDNYTFDNKNLWRTDELTGRKKKIKKRDVWGFSDGIKIYASWKKYDELLEQGRYCYFIDKGTKIVFFVSAFPFSVLPIPLPYRDEMIIDFNTGETQQISKKLFKEILLEDDPELLDQFKKEPQKGKKLLEYVIKYNDRNVSKIQFGNGLKNIW